MRGCAGSAVCTSQKGKKADLMFVQHMLEGVVRRADLPRAVAPLRSRRPATRCDLDEVEPADVVVGSRVARRGRGGGWAVARNRSGARWSGPGWSGCGRRTSGTRYPEIRAGRRRGFYCAWAEGLLQRCPGEEPVGLERSGGCSGGRSQLGGVRGMACQARERSARVTGVLSPASRSRVSFNSRQNSKC